MKNKIWLIPVIVVFVIALILFLPIPQGSYDDGGTREYAALTYKIVAWNKIMAEVDENGEYDGKPKYGGHPNETGCKIWAELLLPTLKEVLEKMIL